MGLEESEGLRSFAPCTERILMYSNEADATGLEMIMDEHIKPKHPFASYLRGEFKRAGVTAKEIATLFPSKTGGLTGCVSNWLNGDNVITEEQYNKIRVHLNGEYLRREYEDLRANTKTYGVRLTIYSNFKRFLVLATKHKKAGKTMTTIR